MIKKQVIFYIVLLTIGIFNSYAQKNEDVTIKVKDTVFITDDFNPLSPSKAAFYSAILPGLGQAYNKKYWKIPIIYGALGSGVYLYSRNNTNFKRARTAFKLMQDDKPHEFDGVGDHILLSEDALISAQKSYKEDRDLSLLVTVGLYVLQILEASTNAHLLQHNVDDNISFKPTIINNDFSNKQVVGASINFNF
ncbi:DUF5683 domain-containing protein [Lutibacter sp. TH_r2]|uniref:DUF5683 domain-containing protein n=1 Tax=Lutibacter sp. TH_r2 TaxID=3082083 RepID=UPI00295494FF|nr:DUF5683 domain-containing protein [Lutibacter sp. TH_r2]MDV7185682.1 DUF5683 domain-containing protein [Lutibacter sp. TH_r2]